MQKNISAKNFLWNLFGTGINGIMSFLYLIVVTRINGVDVSGVFSVCLSVSFILFAVSNLGNRIYEVADFNGSDSDYFTLKVFSGILSIFLGLLCCFVFGYDTKKSFIVFLLILVRIIESFSDTFYAVFQKNERLDLVGISYIIKNAVALVIFIVFDLITKNILISTGFMLLGTLGVYLFFDRILCKRYADVHFENIKSSLSLIKKIFYFFVFNLVVIIISNIPRLIADTKYNSEEMGYFSIIMMIPTAMALIGQFIIQPFVTGFVKNYKDRNYTEFIKTAGFIICILCLCALICSFAAYYFGPFVLTLIMGIEFKKFAFIMVIAIISGTFNILTTVLSNLLTVMNKTKIQLLLYVFSLVIEIASIYYGVSVGGLSAVFVAFLISMIIQFIIFLVYFLFSFIKEKSN